MSDVFLLMDAFLEHHSEWSDHAVDLQQNDVSLFVENGVCDGLQSGSLEFCFYWQAIWDGKTFRGVLSCRGSGSNIECRYRIDEIGDDNKTSNHGDMCYHRFKKYYEEFPPKQDPQPWVFDIVRGELTRDALAKLQNGTWLSFSSEILAHEKMAYVPSAISPEASAAPSAAEAAANVVPDFLRPPPGYVEHFGEFDPDVSPLFGRLIELCAHNTSAKTAMEDIWTEYDRIKDEVGSGKTVQVLPEDKLQEALKGDETLKRSRSSKGEVRNVTTIPVKRDAECGFRAICMYIGCYYPHRLRLAWSSGFSNQESDVPHHVEPQHFPWIAETSCPSLALWHDVGEGFCGWYSATLPAALALNLTQGDDLCERVPDDYKEDDCFALVLSTHWAKAFKAVLLAYLSENWAKPMTLNGNNEFCTLLEQSPTCSTDEKINALAAISDEVYPEGQTVWCLASQYVFDMTSANNHNPKVLCFHGFLGTCHPNTRFYGLPRPCLINENADPQPMAYMSFLGENVWHFGPSSNTEFAFIPVVSYMCKGKGIYTFSTKGAEQRAKKEKVHHFSLLFREGCGSIKQIVEDENETNPSAYHACLTAIREIRATEAAAAVAAAAEAAAAAPSGGNARKRKAAPKAKEKPASKSLPKPVKIY